VTTFSFSYSYGFFEIPPVFCGLLVSTFSLLSLGSQPVLNRYVFKPAHNVLRVAAVGDFGALNFIFARHRQLWQHAC
jgi:hypothetical protein